MLRVLLIDDDAVTLLAYKGLLREFGYYVATAALGDDGVTTAQRDEFDVVLCDLRLPDISGVEVVKLIRKSCPRTKIVLVTGWGSYESALEATGAGATSQVNKPLTGDDLVRVVEDAARLPTSGDSMSDLHDVGYAARRWADLVIRGTHLSEDPKTLLAWSRGIGVAPSTLKKRCQIVGITAKRSLDFVRVIRIVLYHPGEHWDFQNRLDTIDHRTANALASRVGYFGRDQIPSVEEFLVQQRLVAKPVLIQAIRERLLPNMARHRQFGPPIH